MVHTKPSDQLSSSSRRSSPSPHCLIQRLFQAAQAEFASHSPSGPPKHGSDSPSTVRSSPSASRRQSQDENENEDEDEAEGHSLSDTLVVPLEEQILDETYELHSRTFHMVLLDPSYSVFVSRQSHGSLVYKIAHHTLVVVGDPLCSRNDMDRVLDDLRQFRRARGLRLAFMGVGASFVEYARAQGWMSFEFGCERVVDPLHNEVLDRKAGKRMLSQNRQLLDSKRGGVQLAMYAPGITGIDPLLEGRLRRLYDDWRQTKQGQQGDGGADSTQAFITAYDIFSQRTRTAFLYAKTRDGAICGMAMLRQLGAEAGFHIDPCIAAADGPRGTTDLLMITAMQILRRAAISYLCLGVEPRVALAGDKAGPLRSLTSRLAGVAYRRVTDLQKVSGKKSYNDKFRPDPRLGSGLHVVFPGSGFHVQEALAIMKVAHVRPKPFSS